MRPALALSAALGILTLACAKADERAEGSSPGAMTLAKVSADASEPTPAPAAAYWATQKLIRTAGLKIEVRDVQAAVHLADGIVRQNGALVADSRTVQDAEERHEATLVIRVPSAQLDATLAALRKLGDVRTDAISTEDVTKEYADLETRLAVKEQTVARLRSLLDNRTAKLADVLEVERELSRAVTELEEMKGERRYYDQQIALSTINLDLVDFATARGIQITRPVGDALHDALGLLAKSIAALIYVIVFLLPWIIVGVPLWWYGRRLRDRFRRR